MLFYFLFLVLNIKDPKEQKLRKRNAGMQCLGLILRVRGISSRRLCCSTLSALTDIGIIRGAVVVIISNLYNAPSVVAQDNTIAVCLLMLTVVT